MGRGVILRRSIKTILGTTDVCSHCAKVKPLESGFYKRGKKGEHGYRRMCIDCIKNKANAIHNLEVVKISTTGDIVEVKTNRIINNEHCKRRYREYTKHHQYGEVYSKTLAEISILALRRKQGEITPYEYRTALSDIRKTQRQYREDMRMVIDEDE